MSTDRYGEFQLYRVRGTNYTFNSSTSYTWRPERDGSLLRLAVSSGGPWTLTLDIDFPSSPIPPVGMRLWVEFYQGGTGSSLITWPAIAKFQTAGDEIPGSVTGTTTIWTGIFSAGASNCFMTKLGEWS